MARPTSRYSDACGTAHTLDLVGDRWALLVARELMLGPRRFSQLQAALPGINPKALSQRLSELEKRAILSRRRLPPPAAVNVYELTEWGYELEEVTAAMGRWAARSPFREPGLSISAVSLLLSFRAMLDRGRAEALSLCIGFQFGEERYHALLEEGSCQILSGEGADEAAVFDGSPDILATTIYIGHSLKVAEAQGLRILGSRDAAQCFIELFPLPGPARSASEII
jgi:DNA-binding HxlR family transcriptional regulator